MKRVLLLAGVFVTSGVAVAQVPPPIVVAPSASAPQQVLLAWMPGEVRCGNAVIAATPMRRPWTSLYWAAPSSDSPKPLSFTFRIGADGRALSIKRDGDAYAAFSDDIAPSLAASQFARGSERSGCRVTYTASRTPLAEAPIEDLISYSLNPISGALPKAGWDRIRPQAATCITEPRPQPLTQVYPDFLSFAGTRGVKDWSMVGYDQDADGKPTHVRIDYGTGNPALDAASIKAIAASRYTGGARTGCRFPFWHAPEKLPAPPISEDAAIRPRGATCPEERNWATKPVLRFPDAYRRRSIEGWAVVTYDVAPWGEIGNVKVVAAEPSDDFGKQAIQVLHSAKLAEAPQGATGCVDRVRFVMGPVGGVVTNEEPLPPPF